MEDATYTRFNDAKVESGDEVLLVRGSDVVPVREELARILEADSHAVRVSGLREPSRGRQHVPAGVDEMDLLEVINLVLSRSAVRDLVGVRVDVIGIESVASLVRRRLYPSSHDRLDTGDT